MSCHPVAGAITIGIRIGIKALSGEMLLLPGIGNVVAVNIGFRCEGRSVEHLDQARVIGHRTCLQSARGNSAA